ncbi:cysteine proteinase [Periconia macrospinosa]|uniref:Ubiquitin carboxyl-terminal hydrolase n=1 Tax=Periconia macrospinosa TaxID=97972 RepID=A0A2V1EB91_9PLEO|nr:cysteine proteinase [Periconia macrospinosa]
MHPSNPDLPVTETTKPSLPTNAVDSEKEPANPMKRSLSEPAAEEQPLQKKNKSPPSTPHKEEDDAVTQQFPSPPEQAATAFDKETWQGFCEIECEPAYFSAILRKMGVQGVTIREVPMLDEDTISFLPQPIFGLVMLFRHREFDNQNQTETCPPDVWFANQMPAQNSCSTLAMIHAILNLEAQEDMNLDIDIGEHMRQFKDFTKDFTPYQRGEAFASWTFVKKIHNSFAKKMDILENDRYVAHKAKRAAQAEALQASAAAPSKSKSKTTKKSSASASTSRVQRGSPDSDDSAANFENNAHHYIAFVPINGTVWKLDGMDAQPTDMGPYDTSSPATWITTISDRVTQLMLAGGDVDYGLFALSQSPLPPLRRQICLADNTIKKIDARLTSLAPSWRDFVPEEDRDPPSPSFLAGFTPEQRELHVVSGDLAAAIEGEDEATLLKWRADLVGEMRGLVAEYAVEEGTEAEEVAAAEARTWDYGPAIRAWVEMLAENGHLEERAPAFAL